MRVGDARAGLRDRKQDPGIVLSTNRRNYTRLTTSAWQRFMIVQLSPASHMVFLEMVLHLTSLPTWATFKNEDTASCCTFPTNHAGISTSSNIISKSASVMLISFELGGLPLGGISSRLARALIQKACQHAFSYMAVFMTFAKRHRRQACLLNDADRLRKHNL